MSQGLGKIEKEILRVLKHFADKGMFTRCTIAHLMRFVIEPSIADVSFGVPVSQWPEYSSVKRAVRSLERKGYLKRYSGWKKAIVELIKVPDGEVHFRPLEERSLEELGQGIKESDIH